MIRSAIVPVAGHGTRLLPATKSQPKEMLPVARKPIVGVPAPLMKLAGFFAQQIGRLGLTPPLTADQVELMCHDNIVRPGANTFAMLGIEPAAPEAILPTYLDRFRVGGRYNQHAPA